VATAKTAALTVALCARIMSMASQGGMGVVMPPPPPPTETKEGYPMKVKDVIEKLKADGWVQVRQESSHRTFKKEDNPQLITVSGHDRAEVYVGQLSDIRRTSGLPLR